MDMEKVSRRDVYMGVGYADNWTQKYDDLAIVKRLKEDLRKKIDEIIPESCFVDWGPGKLIPEGTSLDDVLAQLKAEAESLPESERSSSSALAKAAMVEGIVAQEDPEQHVNAGTVLSWVNSELQVCSKKLRAVLPWEGDFTPLGECMRTDKTWIQTLSFLLTYEDREWVMTVEDEMSSAAEKIRLFARVGIQCWV